MQTDEHRLLRDSLREFAANRLTPFAADWDRNATFPKQALSELAGLGAFGIAVPEEYGGAGMDATAIAIALEEIAFGDGAVSTIISVNNSPYARFAGLGERSAEAEIPGAMAQDKCWARFA